MFLHVSVILFTGGYPGPYPGGRLGGLAGGVSRPIPRGMLGSGQGEGVWPGGGGSPGPYPGGDVRGSGWEGSRPRPRPRGVSRPRPGGWGVSQHALRQTLPADSYCCGRYASYWNAFMFIMVIHRLSVNTGLLANGQCTLSVDQ